MALIALSLGTLFYVVVLVVNAIAILHEERFLARIGLNQSYYQNTFGENQNSIKARIINLMSAVRTLLRIPLIAINIVVIIYELILG
ncbi:Yos1-like protein, partial [Cladochytrium replicatum]